MTFNNDQTALGYNKLTNNMIEVLSAVRWYVKAKYNLDIKVTDTYRTQEEQDKIYASNERYKVKKWQSVHQGGRGADISVKGMTNEMINDIVDTMNRIKYSDKHKTALSHNVGWGNHIHLQVPYSRCKQDEQ